MRLETRQDQPGMALVMMLLAAGLAVWLLLEPGLLRNLPLPLRLPLILLGVWALGAAFMQGLGLQARRGWFRRATTPPWNLLALAMFTLIVAGRALVG